MDVGCALSAIPERMSWANSALIFSRSEPLNLERADKMFMNSVMLQDL